MKLKKYFTAICMIIIILCSFNNIYATQENQLAEQNQGESNQQNSEQNNQDVEPNTQEENDNQDAEPNTQEESDNQDEEQNNQEENDNQNAEQYKKEETSNENIEEVSTEKNETIKAKVLKTIEIKDEVTDDLTNKVQYVKLRILNGELKDDEYEASYILSHDIDNKILAYELKAKDIVYVDISKNSDGTVTVQVQDLVRQNYLIWMIGLFFASILIIGKKQGLKAIIGLVFTILIIFFILVGSIYKGYNAILMAVIASLITIVVVFAILGGFNKKVMTAAIGTIGGVIISALIALLFGRLAKLSGAQEDAILLSVSAKNLVFNFRELIVAGIIVSSLGATMDVGMSIASSLDEIKKKRPDITPKELFKSGMNIGADVIGTMTNTLILAYVGGALTLILLLVSSNYGFADIINKEMIVTDAVSALAGSIGVVYTIPTTSFAYCFLNRNKTTYDKKSKNKIDGKRSLKI